MQHIMKFLGKTLGLLLLGSLVVILAVIFSNLKRDSRSSSSVLQSPIRIPTPTSIPPSVTPRPYLVLTPTATKPPESPTRAPAPTPKLLPTLLPELDTFLYATTGVRGPEIYRLQLELSRYKIVSPAYRTFTPDLWRSRTYLEALHSSFTGMRVAVSWTYGEGGTFVSILDVNDGTFKPLFGEEATIDQRAEFLAWSPVEDHILVLGGIDNPDLGGQAWLVDQDSGTYKPINIHQTTDARQITGASFSPDGQEIIYAKSDCYQCGSEVWRISLEAEKDKQLLLKDPEQRIEDVLWSPDGQYIAFTRWREAAEMGIGELWVMDFNGRNQRFLSPVATGYSKRFAPIWSPDSKSIAFLLTEEGKSEKQMNTNSFNVYVVDILSESVRQLTHFENYRVFNPIFSPDGTTLAFVVSRDGLSDQFEPWIVFTNGRSLRRIDSGSNLVLNAKASAPAIAWIRQSFSDCE